MRGRKPKPIEEREREGNPSNRPLPEPVRTGAASVQPPDDLPADAVEFWNDIVPRLAAAGVLDQVDRAGAAAMSIAYARAVMAGRVIKQQGHYAVGSTGQMTEHPALGTERSSLTLFIRIAEQYGVTPIARARAAAALQARGSADELDKVVRSGPVEVEDELDADDGEYEDVEV